MSLSIGEPRIGDFVIKGFYILTCHFHNNWLYSMYPVNIIMRTTTGPPAKRHSNGVSLVARYWPEIVHYLGSNGNIAGVCF